MRLNFTWIYGLTATPLRRMLQQYEKCLENIKESRPFFRSGSVAFSSACRMRQR
jgi:hypothetical protein